MKTKMQIFTGILALALVIPALDAAARGTLSTVDTVTTTETLDMETTVRIDTSDTTPAYTFDRMEADTSTTMDFVRVTPLRIETIEVIEPVTVDVQVVPVMGVQTDALQTAAEREIRLAQQSIHIPASSSALVDWTEVAHRQDAVAREMDDVQGDLDSFLEELNEGEGDWKSLADEREELEDELSELRAARADLAELNGASFPSL